MRPAIIAILVVAVLLAACTKVQPPQQVGATQPVLAGNSDLKVLSSQSDLRDFLLKSQSSQVNFYGGTGGIRREAVLMSADSSGKSAAPTAAPSVAGGSDDFSGTNVQIEGVDEADIIKTDGKFIYTISGNSLVIVDAQPAKDSKIVSQLDFRGTPRNVFVNGDRLVVFADGNEEVMRIWEGDFVPRPSYVQTAQVFVYDISDRTSPKKVQNYSIDGYYFESRMIGDYVYFIAQNYADYSGPVMPFIRGSKMLMPPVYYWDVPDYSYSFYTVASLDVTKGPESLQAKSFLLGQSTTLFASSDALYLAARQMPGWNYWRNNNDDTFYQAVLPVLPADVQAKINALGKDVSWQQISSVLEEMYNSMDKGEQDALIKKIEQALKDHERKVQLELSKTTIHKLTIKNGVIDYAGKGQVSGYPLNQFSMDEYEGNLRIATTTEFWTRDEQVQHNNVFVLDPSMKVIGSLENLAKDERIYSTRFIGDRLYMVTFKRIDPLFVIDLSNPSAPKVLGELKIPGYSDYLHPYDATHIIGIGRDTKDTEWGGVTTAGLKFALFDVSDVENPKQIAQYHINGSGTDSEALREHKAFLFDKAKNLLVIPVREVKNEGRYDYRFGYYPARVWEGAYVFGLTPQDGFTLKGKIAHYEGDENGWFYGNGIRRSLYIGDALFTLSYQKLMAHNLNDVSQQFADLKLPILTGGGYPGSYPGQPIPVDIGGGTGAAVEDVK